MGSAGARRRRTAAIGECRGAVRRLLLQDDLGTIPSKTAKSPPVSRMTRIGGTDFIEVHELDRSGIMFEMRHSRLNAGLAPARVAEKERLPEPAEPAVILS